MSVFALALFSSACTAAPAQAETTEAPQETAAETAESEAGDSESGVLSFSLTTITGEAVDDSIVSGNKLTMVNFWATWCGPCVGEIPDLQQISEDYADKGFSIIGVLLGDDDVDGAVEFLGEQGVTYPVVLPEGPFDSLSTNIYAIPTTMFFDSDGEQVGETVVGAKSYEDWTGLIDLLLGQVS